MRRRREDRLRGLRGPRPGRFLAGVENSAGVVRRTAVVPFVILAVLLVLAVVGVLLVAYYLTRRW